MKSMCGKAIRVFVLSCFVCRYQVFQKCWLHSGRERPTFSELVLLLETEKSIIMKIESGLNSHMPQDRPYFVLENSASVATAQTGD